MNDLAYILYESNAIDAEGNRTYYLQYNTAVRGELISFVLLKDSAINEMDRHLMASVMERVSIGNVVAIQDDTSGSLLGNIQDISVNPDDIE